MTDIAKLTEWHLADQRTKLKNKSVEQMDRLLPPNGRKAYIAFGAVRLERLAEEYRTASIAKLRRILDVTDKQITDEQLGLLDVRGEANDKCGIVVRLKTDIEAEKEANRLKMEAEHG